MEKAQISLIMQVGVYRIMYGKIHEDTYRFSLFCFL